MTPRKETEPTPAMELVEMLANKRGEWTSGTHPLELIDAWLARRDEARDKRWREAVERYQAFVRIVFDSLVYSSSEQLPKPPAPVGGPLSMADYEDVQEYERAKRHYADDVAKAKTLDPIIKEARALYKISASLLASPSPASSEPCRGCELGCLECERDDHNDSSAHDTPGIRLSEGGPKP